MLPAACASTLHGAKELPTGPQLTTVAKAGTSLTYALVGGLAVAFVFLALAEITTLKRSWWWSLGFLFATGFLAYTKATWSVLPAATAVAAVAWIALRSQRGKDSPRKTVLLAAVAVGLGGLARYSVLPFLLVGAVAAVFPAISKCSRRDLALAATVLLALTVPDLAYNALRTGEFWKPAQTASGDHQITFSYALSTPGMFFGFQHGLLFFAPICLLGYFAAAYFAVRSFGETRWRWIVGILALVSYAALVCAVQNWDRFGWGPRYLVPLLPALFLAAAAMSERWREARSLSYLLVGLGLLSQIPLMFADWTAVAAAVGKTGETPSQIVGIWNSMLHGFAHGNGIGEASSARALQVPDVWWWHVVANHAPFGLGIVLLLSLTGGIAYLGSRVCGEGEGEGAPATSGAAALS
jgi:hypothetical protein